MVNADNSDSDGTYYSNGNGDGNGEGDGTGYSDSNGNGDSYGDGDSYSYGDGNGYGYGNGNGNSKGYGGYGDDGYINDFSLPENIKTLLTPLTNKNVYFAWAYAEATTEQERESIQALLELLREA